MEGLLRDLVHGVRRLAAQPGSSLVILLTLALGTGVNTAIFSLINGMVLRDLPFERGAEIVEIRQRALPVGAQNIGVSVAEIADYRAQNSTLEALVEFHFMYFFIEGAAPALVKTGIVSANYFDFLGVRPLAGRLLVASDDHADAAPVVLLSHAFWRSHYGADPAVVGQTIALNGRSHEVVGVLPPMPQFPEASDIYLPTAGCPTRSSASFASNRGARMMSLYGRTRPGVSLEQAASDIGLIAARFTAAHPETYPAAAGIDATVLSLQDELTRPIRPTLQLLLVASLLVLLVTCSNVVNLTLARHSSREPELALRVALGASRFDIARRLLSESMLLALAGGIGGLLIAHLGLDLLLAFAAGFSLRAGEVALDGHALAFNMGIALLAGLVAGLAPLLAPKRSGAVLDGVRSTPGRRAQAGRRLMIVGQVAIAFVLVIGAGVTLRSLLALQAVDPGFRSADISAVTVPLNWSRYDEPQSIRSFLQGLERELPLAAEERIAFADGYPFGNGVGIASRQTQILFDDRAADATRLDQARYRTVSNGFFDLLDIPLQRGRLFGPGDDEAATPVAVISAAMAARHWPDSDPLGRRFSNDGGVSWLTVVGVVGDVRDTALDRPVADAYYLPYLQAPAQTLNVLVASRADPAAIATRVREAVRRLDPGQPLGKVTTLDAAIADTLATPRLLSQVLGAFSTLTLAIAMVGVSGLLAFTVSQRIREFGIQMALGADPARIRRHVLGQGLGLVSAGMLLGLIVCLVLGALASGLIPAGASTDPATQAGAALLFALIALASCWSPAARASRLDPNVSLRMS